MVDIWNDLFYQEFYWYSETFEKWTPTGLKKCVRYREVI